MLRAGTLEEKKFGVKQWNEGWMARAMLKRLKQLQSKTNPRITAATWGFIWNRWSSGKRFQKTRNCVICQHPESKDEADHYPYCTPMRAWAQKTLNIDPTELGNRHAWTLTLPALESNDKLVALGIWVYVTYRCLNHQREHGSPLQHEDLNRALNQWMKEAAKNTPGVATFLKQRWPKTKPEEEALLTLRKRRRSQVHQSNCQYRENKRAKQESPLTVTARPGC